MPTYEYRCPSCGNFDWVQGITESVLSVCPKCSAEGIERLFTPTANIVVKTVKSKSSDDAGAAGGMGDLGGMGEDFGSENGFGGDDDLGEMGDLAGGDADGDFGGGSDEESA